MTSKKQKSKQKTTFGQFVLLMLYVVVLYIYTSFIWLLIIGGIIIAIGAFLIEITFSERLIACAIGLAVSGLGLFLSRRFDKNIFKTTPPWSM